MVFLRIGIHTFTRGSLEIAARKAAELGANTFQIFSSSPRMWRAAPLKREQIAALNRVRDQHNLDPLVIHVNYLVNLATLDPVVRQKSIAAFREELERAEEIGAEYVVLHPGSYRGQTLDQGMAAFALGMEEATSGLRLKRIAILIENTVGCGSQLGCKFEELRRIYDLASQLVEAPVGYCLDTCHLLAAGYNVASEDGLRETARQADRILGLENVKVIHTNDSKKPLGSRLDRHANIGEGHIGLEGFRRILGHPKLKDKPFILETPVDNEGDDRRNLETLKSLCRRSRTITSTSS